MSFKSVSVRHLLKVQRQGGQSCVEKRESSMSEWSLVPGFLVMQTTARSNSCASVDCRCWSDYVCEMGGCLTGMDEVHESTEFLGNPVLYW